MGFLAGELEAVLRAHVSHPNGSPWSILTRIGVHPQQIDRLKKAYDDIGQVATLQGTYLQRLRQELEMSPTEWARLQAGIEADTFLRLLLYHNFPLEDAANKANAVFSQVLNQVLTGNNRSDTPLSEEDVATINANQPRRPRGVRRRRADHEATSEKKQDEYEATVKKKQDEYEAASREKQLSLLSASVTENNGCQTWNIWRRSNWDEKVKRYKTVVDLSCISFTEGNFRHADLSDICFANADFRNANFYCARLARADLTHTFLWNINLTDADLSGVDLSGANLQGATLKNTNLSGANLTGADLTGARFNRANLHEATFAYAILANAEFYGVNTNSADFRNANLDGVTGLSGADLSGGHFDGATFTDVALIKTNFTGAFLAGAIFRGADLKLANFSSADLVNTDFENVVAIGANFAQADLSHAKFGDAILVGSHFTSAKLSGANFHHAELNGTDLVDADLIKADLIGACLSDANLTHANLTCATLIGTDLSRCIFVETILERADMSGATIYGIAAWNVQTEGANQTNLLISRPDEPIITVDNLEVAQFIYLLLNNERIRDMIDTMAKKAVLILGRFTSERLSILQALREELRKLGYLPILFDFVKSEKLTYTETALTLAHLSCFIIADLTAPKSISQELQAITPNVLSVPVQPLYCRGAVLLDECMTTMSQDFLERQSVLPLVTYDAVDDLLVNLTEKVIAPAVERRHQHEEKRKEIEHMVNDMMGRQSS